MSMATYYSNWAHHHLALSRSGAYLYVVNHKAACSTVLRSVWSHEAMAGRVDAPPPDQGGLHRAMHNRDLGPWRDWSEEATAAPVRFTVVRNPYTRIASCYFDKMLRPSPQRRFFVHNAGLDPTEKIGFRAFLQKLAELPRELDDTHWARQSFNTGARLLDLTHIGKVETLEDDLPRILADIEGGAVGVANAAPHATGAEDRLRALYGPEELELVNRIYQTDFTMFGYPMNDLDDLAGVPVNPKGMPMHREAPAILLLILAAAELNNGQRKRAMTRLEGLIEAKDELLRRNALFLLAKASHRRRRIAVLEQLLEEGATDPIISRTLAAAIAARGRVKRAKAILTAAPTKPVSAGYFHRQAAKAGAMPARP
jgi:hypothetical protein